MIKIKNILDDVKIGRPTDDPKTITVRTRISDSDNEILEELEDRLGMNKSEILRRGIKIQHRELNNIKKVIAMKKTFEFITNKGIFVRLELNSEDLDHTKICFNDFEIKGYVYPSAVDGIINVLNKEMFEIEGKKYQSINFEVNNYTYKAFYELHNYLKVYDYRKRNNLREDENTGYLVIGDEVLLLNDPIYYSYDPNSSYRILDFKQTSVFCRNYMKDNNLKGHVYFWEFYEAICSDEELLNYTKENGKVNGRMIEAEIPKELFESVVEKVIKNNHERVKQIYYNWG